MAGITEKEMWEESDRAHNNGEFECLPPGEVFVNGAKWCSTKYKDVLKEIAKLEIYDYDNQLHYQTAVRNKISLLLGGPSVQGEN